MALTLKLAMTPKLIPLNDVPVKFINLENLKKNKLASGQLQDLADLEKLQDE